MKAVFIVILTILTIGSAFAGGEMCNPGQQVWTSVLSANAVRSFSIFYRPNEQVFRFTKRINDNPPGPNNPPIQGEFRKLSFSYTMTSTGRAGSLTILGDGQEIMAFNIGAYTTAPVIQQNLIAAPENTLKTILDCFQDLRDRKATRFNFARGNKTAFNDSIFASTFECEYKDL